MNGIPLETLLFAVLNRTVLLLYSGWRITITGGWGLTPTIIYSIIILWLTPSTQNQKYLYHNFKKRRRKMCISGYNDNLYNSYVYVMIYLCILYLCTQSFKFMIYLCILYQCTRSIKSMINLWILYLFIISIEFMVYQSILYRCTQSMEWSKWSI